MTIRVDIGGQDALSELVAHIDAGEDVELVRDGETIAMTLRMGPAAKRGKRVPGAWAHLGKLQDPDLFLRPDPELEEAADGPIFPTT
ncbi:MAG: hypothetical protein JWP92_1204 [Caulobacter sp.]|nr:hypothetical protein [Caulobacter sp.]